MIEWAERRLKRWKTQLSLDGELSDEALSKGVQNPMSKTDFTSESEAGTGIEFASLFSASLYAIFVVAVSALMLVLNAVLCLSAHTAILLFGPESITQNPEIAPRASQMFYFIAPVVLMVLEWNLLDRLFRLFDKDKV